jgi:hypothetical protein
MLMKSILDVSVAVKVIKRLHDDARSCEGNEVQIVQVRVL